MTTPYDFLIPTKYVIFTGVNVDDVMTTMTRAKPPYGQSVCKKFIPLDDPTLRDTSCPIYLVFNPATDDEKTLQVNFKVKKIILTENTEVEEHWSPDDHWLLAQSIKGCPYFQYNSKYGNFYYEYKRGPYVKYHSVIYESGPFPVKCGE